MDDRKERRRQGQQARWEDLVALLSPKYPDIHRVKEQRDWDRFRAVHPELRLERNAFFDYVLASHERVKGHDKQQGHGASSPPHSRGSHGSSAFDPAYMLLSLLLKPKPEIMEQDKKYKKIEKELTEEWKKKNPTIEPGSKEEIDYIYGSLEDPNAPTLAQEAEKRFRERHPKEAEKYDKKKDVVYKNIEDDHKVAYVEKRIEEHTDKRFALAKKTNPQVKRDDIRIQVAERAWVVFAKQHKEKAKGYAQKHEGIKKAVEAINKPQAAIQKAAAHASLATTTPISQTPVASSPPPFPSVPVSTATQPPARPTIPVVTPKPLPLSSPPVTHISPAQQPHPPAPLITLQEESLSPPKSPEPIAPVQKPLPQLQESFPKPAVLHQQSIPQTISAREETPLSQPPPAPKPPPPVVPPQPPVKPPQPSEPAGPVEPPVRPPIVPPSQPRQRPHPAPTFQQRRNLLDRVFQQINTRMPRRVPPSSAPLPQQSTPQANPSPAAPSSPRPPSPPRPAPPPLPNPAQLGRLARFARAFTLTANPWMIVLIVGVVVFLLFMVFFLALTGGGIALLPGDSTTPGGGGQTSSGVTGAGCPTPETLRQNSQDRNTCRLLKPSINIFDANIDQASIESYIAKYSPIFVRAGKGDTNAFRQRVNYIISKAKEAGLNPAIFLGYWRTESAFSTVGNRDMGCAGSGFYEQVDCAVGLRGPTSFRGALCARSGNADSPSCKELKGIRSHPIYTNYPISYPIKTFDDFVETYGPMAPGLDGPGTLNNNCISTYNKLIEVAIELQACKATLSVPSQGLATVLEWAQKINDALQSGLPPSSFNKMLADISNGSYTATKRQALDRGVSSTGIYWCTNLVIDSYNLAGAKGLGPNHQGVRGMLDFWKKTSGYVFIPYTGADSLRQAKPGQAFFRINPPDYQYNHVSILKNISVDERGNGVVETIDSNSSKGWKSTVASGRIVETYFLSRVAGFGGLAEQPGGQQNNLQSLFASLPQTSAAAVITPDGNRTQLNGAQQMPSASVIKLWVAAAVYDGAQNGTLDLSETHTITSDNIAPGTGVLHQQVGKVKTYAELVELMLVYSDNSATNILIDKLGGFDTINSYASRNGYTSTRLQRKLGYPDSARENYTSANDAVTFMQNLYGLKVVNQDASNAIISILKKRRQYENKAYDYIGRYLPSGVDYVEKSGLGTGVRNDAGSFLTKSGARVSVAIFLSNNNERTQEEAIGKTVQQLYNSIP